ncbi:MAG TPA: hypothetical protein ENJ79_08875 [Gammaproteobacteria bacterium]|nr:hypothetical protein [Gammaproteobacteria bacterium]
MSQKRKRHSAEFTAKVALEAVKGLKTSSELAREYQVHPAQISQWIRQLLDTPPEIFRSGMAAQHSAAGMLKPHCQIRVDALSGYPELRRLTHLTPELAQ